MGLTGLRFRLQACLNYIYTYGSLHQFCTDFVIKLMANLLVL